MQVSKGELQNARGDTLLAGRKVGDGFRIIRDVKSRDLTKITDALAQRVISSWGNLAYIRQEQAFRPGLPILGDRSVQLGLEEDNRSNIWNILKVRDLREQLVFLAGAARRARLPESIPARVASFYYERIDGPEGPDDPIQYIRCRLESEDDINLQLQQLKERTELLRKGFGIVINSQEKPQEMDGTLTYAVFKSGAYESTVRGIVNTLNWHAADVGIAVTMTPLTYQAYSGQSKG